MKETIRQILAEVARLDVPIETLDDQADLTRRACRRWPRCT